VDGWMHLSDQFWKILRLGSIFAVFLTDWLNSWLIGNSSSIGFEMGGGEKHLILKSDIVEIHFVKC
jgi:hypothetical protein